MSWDRIRKPFEEKIREISKSIDRQLELWAKTGNIVHKKFADDEIKNLHHLKEYIMKEERKIGIIK